MPAPLPALSLSVNDREQIGRWLSAQGTPQQVALRSRIVLAAAAAQSDSAIANDLALLLNDWREKTLDVIPSEFAGTRISERYTETYLHIHGRPATSRSAIATDRGITDIHQ